MARALIVEDDVMLSRSLALLLGARGHQVRIANSLLEAASVLSGWPADVVVTDLMFPRGRAVDLIRATQRNPIPTAVIVFTGVSDVELHAHLVGCGAAGVIVKGTDSPQMLVDAVEKSARYLRMLPS